MRIRRIRKSLFAWVLTAALLLTLCMGILPAPARALDENAQTINLNALYTGSLASSKTENWYKIVLPKNGAIRLTFGHEYVDSSNAYWRTEFFTAANTGLGITSWKGNATVDGSSCYYGLAAGTYYLHVYKGTSYHSSVQYHFTVEYTASNYWEREFNDTIVTANPISVNAEYNGSISTTSDEDWYQFTLPKDGMVQLTFGHEYVDSSNNYWRTEFYTPENTGMGVVSWKGNATVDTDGCCNGLAAGTYYLRVLKGSSYRSDVQYHFTLHYTASDAWEKEFNETVVRANPVPLNTAISGSIRTSGDIDYYEFNVPFDDTITLNFGHEYISSSNNYWRTELFTAENQGMGIVSHKGNVDNSTGEYALSAGTYYLKVYQGSSYRSDLRYTFTLSTSVAPLTVTSLKANKSSAGLGESITWTATGAGGTGSLQYCFYVFKDGKIAERGTYGAGRTYTYIPTAAGTYTARVYVKDTRGMETNLTGGAVSVGSAQISITGVTPNRTTAVLGDSITWTASATGGTGTLQYCFYVFKNGKVDVRGSFGTARTFTYAPAAAGTYTVRVYVKDGSGTTVSLDNAGAVTVSNTPLSLTGVTPSRTTVTVGESIAWTASASGGTGTIQYCFYVFKDGKISVRGAYSTAKTYTYTPTAAGTYTVRVYAKDGTGTAQNLTGGAVNVANEPLNLIGVIANKNTAAAGDSITWTAASSGGTGTIQYCFYVFKDGKIDTRGASGTANVFTYTPTAAGTSTVRVYAKDGTGTTLNLTGGAVTVSGDPLMVIGAAANQKSVTVGTEIKWTAAATGGVGTLQYCFYVFRNGSVVQRGSYSTAATFTYTPATAGTYTVRVYVKDGSGASAILESQGPVTVS